MFSNFIIALIMGFGAGFWIYLRVMRSSGNNSKNSLTAGGVTFALVFVFLLILLDTLIKAKKH